MSVFGWGAPLVDSAGVRTFLLLLELLFPNVSVNVCLWGGKGGGVYPFFHHIFLPPSKHRPFHAMSVGVLAGATGVGMLACMVNPVSASLGAINIVLYAGVYTPMKRTSIANTVGRRKVRQRGVVWY